MEAIITKYEQRIKLANVLLEYNCNLDQQNAEYLLESKCEPMIQRCIKLVSKFPELNKFLKEYYIPTCKDIELKDSNGHTPLFRACVQSANPNQEALQETIQILLDAGANPNAVNNNKTTIISYIMLKFTNSSLETFNKLIEAGADLNIQDRVGKATIHYFVGNLNINSIKLLNVIIEKTNDINIRTYDNFTVLHLVSNNYTDSKELLHFELCNQLIKAGIDINEHTKNGNTALHLAARSSTFSTKLFELLLGYGIDPTIKNNSNKTAFDELKLPIQKYYNSNQEAECSICYTILKTISCSYNHPICGQCLVKLCETRKMPKCSVCDNNY